MMEDRDAQLRQSLIENSPSDEVKKRPNYSSKRIKRPKSAWFIFDDLSHQQAEDLLRQHGKHSTYLISHFHDPESFQLVIRFDEKEGLVFKHYAMRLSGSNKDIFVEGVPGNFKSLEDGIVAVEEQLSVKLTPIFNNNDCETCDDDDDDDLSFSASQEAPPDYAPAQKYPEAPRRPLPVIVPIRPTLRRLQQATLTQSMQGESDNFYVETDTRHGCCWKACHTDPGGHWYKPHKAGPCMAILLIIGWFFFLLLFGWIVALALLLVGVLVVCAYALNFMCTGRCSIDDDDD